MTGQARPGAATPATKVTARDSKTATPAMLQTMGLAYIHAWLTEDYWTIAQITLALEASGASWQQVAESFSLAAASLLTDVFDGSSTLAAVAAIGKARGDAARQARAALRAAGLSRLHVHPGIDVVSWRGDRGNLSLRSVDALPVRGDPGVGKTVLLDHLAGQVPDSRCPHQVLAAEDLTGW